MNIYTYRFAKSLSNSLGIDFLPISSISDQELTVKPTDCCSVTAPMSEETRKAISLSRMGQPAPNKGIANPAQSERWKQNNPMFNLDARERMRQSKIGKRSSNYVEEMRTFICDTCDKENIVRNVKGGKTRRFCNRSCQATFTNKNRRGFNLVYISQPPAAEHASS